MVSKKHSKTYNYPELKKSDILTLLKVHVPLFTPVMLVQRLVTQDREGAFFLATKEALDYYKVIHFVFSSTLSVFTLNNLLVGFL